MSLKVKFLKRHLKWNIGDTATVDNTQAQYMARMQIVEIVDGSTPQSVEKVLEQHLEPEKKVVPVEKEPKATKTIKKKKEIK